MAEPEYKTCRRCGQRKAATAEFYYRVASGKWQARCRRCVIEAAAQWAALHPEAVLASRVRRAVKLRAKTRAWRIANPERYREKQRQMREKHPERYRQYVRDWIARNPERKRLQSSEYAIRRRAQMFGDGNRIDLVNYAAILERDGMVCHICGEAIQPETAGGGKLNFDHVIPLAKGGQHSAENIRPSHFSCNRAKSDRL